MLRTDQRALLLDLLSPPADGYVLEHAVGTTFTLQLDALLRAPLAVAGAELRDGLDPLGVMQAVRHSADRITVFCQAGMIAAPPAPNRLLAFLEPVVHAVRRPANGHLFHPKVWLTAWTSTERPRRFRFLCGSRNITADRAWDAVVGLDGEETTRLHAVNGPLAEFIASLPARTVLALPPERRSAIDALADAVRSAEWTPPEGTVEEDWLTFHWLDRGRPLRRRARNARRQLVISPFVTAGGLAATADGGELVLISRAEQIAALDPEERDALTSGRRTSFHVLDDTAALPDEGDAATGLRWSLRGLHAKVYVSECPTGTHLLLGSANATDHAFKGNTEFLVELVCRRRKVRIDRMLADEEGALGDLLQPWNPEEPAPEPDPSAALEQALVDLATVALAAEARQDAEEVWTLTLTSDHPLLARTPLGVRLAIRPLTLDRLHGASLDTPLELTWDGLEGDQLTPFFVLELRDGPGAQATVVRSIVRATLAGAPEDRLDRVLARHVDSPEAFLRFLMILLQFTDAAHLVLPEVEETGAAGRWLLRMQRKGILESVLHALATHPEMIEEIDRLVARLEATEAGRARLPEGWDALWKEVRLAYGQLYGHRRRSA
ncbi:MAG: phospholipase D family protein [Pseudomonadales bacterium]|jgi:hypothetical protein|nr:phospholipase D family protein [Pseudomonadales bacterium]